AAPGAQVHLVDGDRRGVPGGAGALGHPGLVRPGMVRLEHDAGRRRRRLGVRGHRVGLLAPHAVEAEDLVLVAGARLDTGDEQLPDAGVAQRTQRVGAAVPEVEVADDSYAPRVRRPDGEAHAGDDPAVR